MTMKNKKAQKLFLVIVLVTALGIVTPMLSGCFGAPAAAPPEAPPAAAPPAAAKTVNIAMVTALSCPAAMWWLPGIS